METLKFNLTITKIPVDLTKEDGTTEHWTLTALDGRGRGDHTNFVMDNTEEYTDDNGIERTRLTDFTAIQTRLISVSMLDAKGKPAPYEQVLEWPSPVCAALYSKAREISGLDEEAKKNSKNDSSENESSG